MRYRQTAALPFVLHHLNERLDVAVGVGEGLVAAGILGVFGHARIAIRVTMKAIDGCLSLRI